MGYRENFANVGCKLPHILLPNDKIDLEKFACIAADQFSHDKNYWKEVDKFVADSQSAYKLMFPEAYMPITDSDINNINSTNIQTYKNTSLHSGRLFWQSIEKKKI